LPDKPVLNTTPPLTPSGPASAVWSTKSPLLAVPVPDVIVTVPPVPVFAVDSPAVIDTAPP